MSEFTFLFRGRDTTLSLEQRQKHTEKWVAWFKELAEKGHLKEHEAGGPNRGAPAEQRQHHLGEHRFHQKEQRGAQKQRHRKHRDGSGLPAHQDRSDIVNMISPNLPAAPAELRERPSRTSPRDSTHCAAEFTIYYLGAEKTCRKLKTMPFAVSSRT